MSSGTTHVKASLFLAAGFSVGALIILNPDMVRCAIGSIMGVMITPDWDVDKRYVGNIIVKKRFGNVADKIFDAWLKPYKTSFKHGQFGSHFPVYGTYGRLLYILMMGILPFYAVYFIILLSLNYHFNLIYELLWWCKILFGSWYTLGLVASDVIHFSLDKLTKNTD